MGLVPYLLKWGKTGGCQFASFFSAISDRSEARLDDFLKASFSLFFKTTMSSLEPSFSSTLWPLEDAETGDPLLPSFGDPFLSSFKDPAESGVSVIYSFFFRLFRLLFSISSSFRLIPNSFSSKLACFPDSFLSFSLLILRFSTSAAKGKCIKFCISLPPFFISSFDSSKSPSYLCYFL